MTQGYVCRGCGERHDELPFAYHAEAPAREAEPPMFGWFAKELPVYEPSTINLKAMVHTRPVGERLLLELEPTDHPLAVEQREGIDRARVRELAELVRHG